MHNTGIIIYGPAGCGKTANAAKLAAHYGKDRIVDEWTPGGPVRHDTIALTNTPTRGAVAFADAARAAGIKLTVAQLAVIAQDRSAK